MKQCKFIILVITGLLSTSASSSDVLVNADFNIGQGFLYQQSEQCFIVTPSHVLGNVSEPTIMLPTRQYHIAKVEHQFPIDLTLLSSDVSTAFCEGKTFQQMTELTKLLDIYKDGILKTRMPDGSVLQTEIKISGIDETEYLSIVPADTRGEFKQGYSGSVLYIADQPAGVLLEVDDQGGIVYRADALTELLNQYFSVDSAPNEVEEPENDDSLNETDETTVNSLLEGNLADNQIRDYPITMQANSPIEFNLIGLSNSNLRYRIKIMDKRENELFNDDFISSYNYKFVFTPPADKELLIRLIGTREFGPFQIQLSQFALDSELRGIGNRLTVPSSLQLKVARNAVTEYRLLGVKNSPLKIVLPGANSDSFNFDLEFFDSKGQPIWKDDFVGTYNYEFTITPPTSEEYLMRVTGTRNFGILPMNIEQWSTEEDLRGSQNVVAAGDVSTVKLADNAVAEYRIMLQKNAPIDFKQDPIDSSLKYIAEIIDETGEVKMSTSVTASYGERFVFTPQSSDVHIIRLTGTRAHGEITFKLFDYE